MKIDSISMGETLILKRYYIQRRQKKYKSVKLQQLIDDFNCCKFIIRFEKLKHFVLMC